jgi:hypothetical protein
MKGDFRQNACCLHTWATNHLATATTHHKKNTKRRGIATPPVAAEARFPSMSRGGANGNGRERSVRHDYRTALPGLARCGSGSLR